MNVPFFLLLVYALTAAHAIERSCNSNICLNGGACKVDDVLRNFRCDCPIGFTGTLCQDTCSLKCVHGKCAKDSAGLDVCNCDEGFHGKLCDLNNTPTKSCSMDSDCKNNTKCLENSRGNKVCLRDPCEDNPCANNSTCKTEKEDYRCECDYGFAGVHCDTDINECELGLCKHGGTCINTEGSFECLCSDKYRGPLCEEVVGFCSQKPCQNNGNCVESATNYHCLCSNGWHGENCEIANVPPADHCSASPCLNNGHCIERENEFECICLPPWTGRMCEESIECNVDGHPCQNGGNCVRGLAMNKCVCTGNWGGKWCEAPVFRKWPDACENMTCENGGKCDPSTAHCICSDGFDGEFCELFVTVKEVEPESTIVTTVSSKSTYIPLGTTAVLKTQNVVDHCSECLNTRKCVQLESSVICICEDGFTGPNCALMAKACNESCIDPHICSNNRYLNGSISSVCQCAIGTTGDNCVRQTSVTFKEESLFVYQSPFVMIGSSSGPLPYSLSFTFRTTVSNVHFASGENIFGQRLFSVFLKEGRIIANVSGTAYSTLLPMGVNDGSWYRLEMRKLEKDMLITLVEENGFELLNREVPRTANFDVFATRIGKVSDNSHFIGCISDVQIDGATVNIATSSRAVSIDKGCQREAQCTDLKCANKGVCVDLWTNYKCDCRPPFLPPSCIYSLEGSTFGHGNKPSQALLSVDQESAKKMQEKTLIQFVMRTNKENGAVICLSDKNHDDIGTFLSAQMIDGYMQVRARAGGKNVMELKGETRIDDNEEHIIKIERKYRHVELYVDDILQSTADIPVRFDHPLFVEQISIGGTNATTSDAFSTKEYFKGLLQDIRINEASVILHKAPDFDLTTIGTVVSLKNVEADLISDDVCSQLAPCVHGSCVNTFNDFQCSCEIGWKGKDCSGKDFCADSPCLQGAACKNTNGGFLCTSPVQLINSSYAQYDLKLPENTPQTVMSSLDFDVKTTDDTGKILELSSPLYSVSLNGGKIEVSANGSKYVVNDVINNGEWTHIRIEGKVASIDGKKYGLPENLSFGSVASLATLQIGSKDGERSMEGALENVTLGDSTPLSFYRPEESGTTGDNDTVWIMKKWNKLSRDVFPSDACTVNPCKNGGQCAEQTDSFKCICSAGFTGSYCEKNIDDCVGVSCGNGYCVDEIRDYRCVCDKGFGGAYCDVSSDYCAEKPCSNGGICEKSNGTYHCECKKGWMGKNCDAVETTLCSDQPCKNGGQCQQQSDGFQCRCKPGYSGVLCEDSKSPCSSHPCKNGRCIEHARGFTCDCDAGFTGETCDSFAPLCSSASPCSHGRCDNIWNGTLCHCDSGWQGGDCSVDVNECRHIPCENDGECLNKDGGYTCACRKYYLGDHCEVAGSCLTNPCEQGECMQLRHDEHRCSCNKGFEGQRCEVQINYCNDSPCRNGGTCENLIGDYKCQCIPGFSGQNCDVDIDECAEQPCKNGGICKDRVADFECDCSETGFSGKNCSVDVNECENPSNCMKGTCTNNPGTYRCQCEYGYIGRRCSMRDPCLADEMNRTLHSCVHGQCINAVVKTENGREMASHECKCQRGYSGPLCSLQEEEKRIAIGYVLGPLVVILLVLCIIGCALFIFVMRGKRATHGHYSPSNQEITGARLQMNNIIKLPPEERLI